MGSRPVIFLIGLVVGLAGPAASEGGGLVHPAGEWAAEWIVAPGTAAHGYGVYHFRRTFELAAVPASFPVHVTADNRYQLLVNGHRVSSGPARGQLEHWRYDTVDLAAQLRPGRNVVAAVVWNFGPHAPMAQVSWRTGFLLQGATPAAAVLNTGPVWKALRNEAYEPLVFTQAQMRGLFIVGPGDRVDGSRYPWDWEQPGFDDLAWPAAEPLQAGRRTPGRSRSPEGPAPAGWQLVPRTIPLMEESPQRFGRVRAASLKSVPPGFPAAGGTITIPPRTKVGFIFDQLHLTTAYPELTVSGGRGATILLGYAESFFEKEGGPRNKGNRDEIQGKQFVGYYDSFRPDGGANRVFRPLWWRTYRYVDLKVETGAEPLTIEGLAATYTGYPFVRRGRLESGDPFLDQVMEVSWRTLRLCAHETFMDCPYYEQLQYLGDTRVQALVALYLGGDPRLVRNAIAQLDEARGVLGEMPSRAPAREAQFIPPFTLWWIGMVHDYWRYVDDPEFVRASLPGVRAVLAHFARHEQDNGSLGRLPGWGFVDWTTWERGIPPAGRGGSSAPQDLLYLLALRWAAELEAALGTPEEAQRLHRVAQRLEAAMRTLYWVPKRRLFADTPGGRDFSQHANLLAVLAGVVEGEEARDLVRRILDDAELEPCSYYFKHYLHEAMLRVGEGGLYLERLGPWRQMLERGLTTWAERPDTSINASRSDCHAWSASPGCELLRTVLGVDSAAPGFRQVSIRPHLGRLTRVAGVVPHPAGEIVVRLDRTDGQLRAVVNLPPGVTGRFHWEGVEQPLVAGENLIGL